MSGLNRPTPTKRISDLTRRLAEDYDTIPLPEVSRVVARASSAAGSDLEWNGTTDGIRSIVDVIEVVAREELDAISARRPESTARIAKRSGPAQPRQHRR